MSVRPQPLVVVLFMLASGCVGTQAGSEEVSSAVQPVLRYGAVAGRVVDEEVRPLENATVTLVEASLMAQTNAGGRFEFTQVLEGTYTLVASLPHYETGQRELFVLGELTADVELTLVKLPEFRPFNVTSIFQGHYDCVAEYLIVTGDCGIAYETVTCLTGYCQSDPVFTEKYQFPFTVNPLWDSVVAELTWTASATNAMEGMRLYVENANASAAGGGHAAKVGRADGAAQPLTVRVDRGTLHPRADVYPGTQTKAYIPDEGGPQQIRVFPMGRLWETTRNICDSDGRCLLGVGAGANVRFNVYLTIFYNEAAPAGFSAVPESG